jgi:hypothetical protein
LTRQLSMRSAAAESKYQLLTVRNAGVLALTFMIENVERDCNGCSGSPVCQGLLFACASYCWRL